jgi:hypothetical protein
MLLAAHIAELDSVDIVEISEPHGNRLVMETYLRPPADEDGRRATSLLLCRIDRDVIEIYGLNPRDRHHLLSRRWGRLHGTGVSLFRPRNEHELEACCFILRRAYEGLVELSDPTSVRARDYWVFDLPKFSRTPLQ